MYYQIKTTKAMTVAKIATEQKNKNLINIEFNTSLKSFKEYSSCFKKQQNHIEYLSKKGIDIISPDGEYEDFEIELKHLSISASLMPYFDETNTQLIIEPTYSAKCVGKAWFNVPDTQEHFGREIDTYSEIEIDLSTFEFDFSELEIKTGVTQISVVIDLYQNFITFHSKHV